jgi:tetratricopeptide (TPR) repeat protein
MGLLDVLFDKFLDGVANVIQFSLNYRLRHPKPLSQTGQRKASVLLMDVYKKGHYQFAYEVARSLQDDFFCASMLVQMGLFREAEQTFLKVVASQKGPKQAALANEALGQLFLFQQGYEKAQECFKAALQLWPERGATHRCIAEVWLRRGDNAPDALREARLAVEKERAGEGITPLTKAINLSEDLATLAWAQAANGGDAAEVDRLAAEAAGLCNGFPVTSTAQVHVHCGMAYAALGDSAKRAQHFEETARVDPQGIWGREATRAAGVPR